MFKAVLLSLVVIFIGLIIGIMPKIYQFYSGKKLNEVAYNFSVPLALLIMICSTIPASKYLDDEKRKLNTSVCDVTYLENGTPMEAKGLSSSDIYISQTSEAISLKGYWAKATNFKITCEKKETP